MSRRSVLRLFASVGVVAMVGACVSVVVVGSMCIHGFSARDEPTALEALLARTMRSVAIPSRYSVLTNPVPATAEAFDRARAHWADHCAGCHGNDGSGRSMLGRRLFPRAPDMRGDATQRAPDGVLYYVIANGIRLSGMPSWGKGGDDDTETWELVHFIRALPRLTQADLRAMEVLNPKSAADVREEQEIDDFLDGASDGSSAPKGTH